MIYYVSVSPAAAESLCVVHTREKKNSGLWPDLHHAGLLLLKNQWLQLILTVSGHMIKCV